MSILVSINCNTYNHEKYIERALLSFLMQEVDFEFEILIYDDASTDSTRDIIEKYQRIYPNIIKPIFAEKNQFSKGIKRLSYRYNHTRAKGKYIAICEGDDYWTDKYKLKKQIQYMQENEMCTMTFHNAEKVNDLTKKSEGYMIDTSIKSMQCTIEHIIDMEFIPTASVIYKKHTLDNAPNWYMNAVVGDLPTELITTCQGYAYYFDDIMSVYRVGNINSMMNKWILEQKKIDDKINHTNKYIEIFNEINKFSEYRYNDYLNKIITRMEFGKEMLSGNIENIKNIKYKEYYDELTFKNKIGVYLRKYSPSLYININIFIYKLKILINRLRSLGKNE